MAGVAKAYCFAAAAAVRAVSVFEVDVVVSGTGVEADGVGDSGEAISGSQLKI